MGNRKRAFGRMDHHHNNTENKHSKIAAAVHFPNAFPFPMGGTAEGELLKFLNRKMIDAKELVPKMHHKPIILRSHPKSERSTKFQLVGKKLII
jgi:hypothetical protein